MSRFVLRRIFASLHEQPPPISRRVFSSSHQKPLPKPQPSTNNNPLKSSRPNSQSSITRNASLLRAMANTAHMDLLTFFYPIGNTPAVSLTRDIPRETKANVLSLGCGDARNILYTTHVAGSTSPMDITCCDIESLVITRNILLFTLILDYGGNRIKDIWDIYYHLFIGPKALALLESQTTRLLAVSDSLESWHASNYGKRLRFCDSSSFFRSEKDLEQSFDQIQRAKDLRHYYIGEKFVFTGMRSAAPLNREAVQDLAKQHKHFWDTGSTDKPNANSAAMPNPMFTSQLNKSSILHYGTDPLLGFHLATAYASLVPQPTSDPHAHAFLQSSAHNLVRAARQQFQAWCKSFRKHAGIMVLRFFVGEALAFCHALQQRKKGIAVGPYRKPGTFETILLNSEDYLPVVTAPMSFSVINTSNLVDHVGAINLLIATSPLLDDNLFATLYTESLVNQEKDHSTLAESFLCGNVSTMSVLLGIFPTDYWTNVVPISTADEAILNTARRRLGDKLSSDYIYSRLS
ncbi:uncharacterized protein K452DRAFT_322363 [Aplosporella prunicola CBS 121167]|uniref:DUF4470 domain-containing protein n=1 Tax=Aplosporella prunicola CBS 121167 TaxID=1176127 RepID=A0A6A6AXP5_9PEZI|nr:uncharacterized protein K452DRAFT_322363 [Aplosporella prunicola CBS 121167]KAF2136540.1 hypothetical protein K452DRAFT_322363 [Aplosporella prunicola CBS 121167]